MNILKDTETLKKYTKVNASLPDESWRHLIPDVVYRYILPLTGGEVFKLANDFAGSSSRDPEMTALLELIERPVACFLMDIYATEGSIAVGDAGHTVIRTEKQAPASDYKIRKYRESELSRAYNGIEILHLFLIERSDKEPLKVWTKSEAYNLVINNYLNTAKDFQLHGLVHIDNNRLFLENNRALMSMVEDEYITTRIYPDTVIRLKYYAKGDQSIILKNHENRLLSLVRRFIAQRVAQIVTESNDNKNDSYYFLRSLYANRYDVHSYFKKQSNLYLSQINNHLKVHPDLGHSTHDSHMNHSHSSFFNTIG